MRLILYKVRHKNPNDVPDMTRAKLIAGLYYRHACVMIRNVNGSSN